MKCCMRPELALLAGISAVLLACSPVEARSDRVSALQELAESDNAEALYHLGMMYLTGSSVGEDHQRAVGYFKEAAELGDPLASYKLGCFYDGQYQLLPVDHDLALQHKLVAAEAGYALAQQDVAALYARQEDYREALVWLARAAGQGTSDALAVYASVHNGAPGIDKDPVKTAAYFRLFLARTGGSAAQREWLENFEADLTAEQLQAARKIVQSYRPAPTQLTLKALSGMEAADRLIKASRKRD
jgi:uncharacterized protein